MLSSNILLKGLGWKPCILIFVARCVLQSTPFGKEWGTKLLARERGLMPYNVKEPYTDYVKCMYQAEVDVHFPQLTVRRSKCLCEFQVESNMLFIIR